MQAFLQGIRPTIILQLTRGPEHQQMWLSAEFLGATPEHTKGKLSLSILIMAFILNTDSFGAQNMSLLDPWARSQAPRNRRVQRGRASKTEHSMGHVPGQQGAWAQRSDS